MEDTLTAKIEMKCFQCGEYITPNNNGICINKDTPYETYQCNDCHLIEYGVKIWGSALVFQPDNTTTTLLNK